ncbi:methyltransferase [Oscillibacter sp.]|uniref:tRNA1(Val) (adenine(37)-N6)-methyltransferase n=1 Tax=Oscillibacter sp. TaxID=1945593 RepID=UPI00261ADB14|nr:methyltransferase [Oscillibacter sp.]MDD3346652.1 methyltransferase [Oscillibacter sp.]
MFSTIIASVDKEKPWRPSSTEGPCETVKHPTAGKGASATEHWEFLKPDGYRFVYDDTLFRPGTDTFLLSSLPRLRPGLRVCDLGCGTGLLCLLLLQREKALRVTGVEVQGAAVSLAERAAEKNGLTDRLSFFQGDLRAAPLTAGAFDLVVCNPPYYPVGSGRLSQADALRTARSELHCTLEEVGKAAARLLRWGGSFCLCHKPERLCDVLCTLRQAGLEPKRLRFVAKTSGAAPSLLLVEGRRGGKPGLTVEPPLLLQTPEGLPTAELDAIYFRTQEDAL